MENRKFQISGNIVDLVNSTIFPGVIEVEDGKIKSVVKTQQAENQYIIPGLIDAHVHIESSMLIPSEFARLAVVHGTVATVSDPHEIANVLGIDGIKYMISNGKKVPFKFYFGASSCVPATTFETSGASLGTEEIEELLKMDEVKYMSEMMNFPGVLFKDPEVMAKIAVAKKYNKPIDGHAPGVMGEDARRYIEAGITTDHECFTMEEALDKIRWGMKIQVREGSAAKNFDALIGLMKDHPDKVLFCSDDKHPNDLEKSHINDLVKRAIAKGYDPLQVFKSCILNPVKHYGLDVGLLRAGDDADFIIVDNLSDFNVHETYVRGILVHKNGKSLIESVPETSPNFFNAEKISVEDLRVPAGNGKLQVIQALDGQLITKTLSFDPKIENGAIISDIDNDVLKLVVYNRYRPGKPSIAFINNFNLRSGAMASTVAHDSHNIIAVGGNDQDLVNAINLLVEAKGGVSFADGDLKEILPLPVAGLMSAGDAYQTAAAYDKIDQLTKAKGSTLKAPYMTLSFMALLVIPDLKLSDKGLFDGKSFAFTNLINN